MSRRAGGVPPAGRFATVGRIMETPETIGKYEVISQIATGGFGVIYKGWDPFIKRPVAIKMCATPDEEVREAFPAGSPVRRQPGPPQHHPGLRLRGRGRGVRSSSRSSSPASTSTSCSGREPSRDPRRSGRDPPPGLRGARVRPPPGHHPPRHQALQHPGSRGRHGQDPGLRHRQVAGGAATSSPRPESLSAPPATSLRSRSRAARSTPAPTSSPSAWWPTSSSPGSRPFQGSSLSNVLYKILNEDPASPGLVNPACSPELDATHRSLHGQGPGTSASRPSAELFDALRVDRRRRDRRRRYRTREITTGVLRDAVLRMDGAPEPLRRPRRRHHRHLEPGSAGHPAHTEIEHSPTVDEPESEHVEVRP